MGKNLNQRRRKQPFVEVEKDQRGGCIWTLARLLNYNRWSSVKKMLPYGKKQESPDEPPTKNKVKPEEEFQISFIQELEDHDAVVLNSASVNSRICKALSTLIQEEDISRRTELANQQISRALSTLIEQEDNFRKTELADQQLDNSDLANQQSQLQSWEDNSAELDNPTLLSLLKADSKVDVPRKHRLARSGTYPSPNKVHNLGFGRAPSKLENKQFDIWPVMNHGIVLRRAESGRMRRSSSLNEVLDKHGHLIDNMGRKEMKKCPSYSEKGITSLGSHHLHRKSYSYGPNEAPGLSLETLDRMSGSKGHSTRDFDSPKHTENLAESQLDENRNGFVDEEGQSNHQEKQELIAEIAPVYAPEACIQEDETEIAESPLAKDSVIVLESTSSFEDTENRQSTSNFEDAKTTESTSNFGGAENTQGYSDQSTRLEEDTEDYNEELEYVKHVLDSLGFLEGGDPYAIWESADESLDPALFDEIELLCPFNPKPSTKDAVRMSSCDRKILYHLIIEALVDIREKSLAYYFLNSLSFSLLAHSMSKGKMHIFEEVWGFVSEYLNRGPQWDPRLDFALARDCSKSNANWKNPQVEIESVGVDLEELIFDDLLDEILCCSIGGFTK